MTNTVGYVEKQRLHEKVRQWEEQLSQFFAYFSVQDHYPDGMQNKEMRQIYALFKAKSAHELEAAVRTSELPILINTENQLELNMSDADSLSAEKLNLYKRLMYVMQVKLHVFTIQAKLDVDFELPVLDSRLNEDLQEFANEANQILQTNIEGEEKIKKLQLFRDRLQGKISELDRGFAARVRHLQSQFDNFDNRVGINKTDILDELIGINQVFETMYAIESSHLNSVEQAWRDVVLSYAQAIAGEDNVRVKSHLREQNKLVISDNNNLEDFSDEVKSVFNQLMDSAREELLDSPFSQQTGNISQLVVHEQINPFRRYLTAINQRISDLQEEHEDEIEFVEVSFDESDSIVNQSIPVHTLSDAIAAAKQNLETQLDGGLKCPWQGNSFWSYKKNFAAYKSLYTDMISLAEQMHALRGDDMSDRMTDMLVENLTRLTNNFTSNVTEQSMKQALETVKKNIQTLRSTHMVPEAKLIMRMKASIATILPFLRRRESFKQAIAIVKGYHFLKHATKQNAQLLADNQNIQASDTRQEQALRVPLDTFNSVGP